jgi:hypothetical protein
MICQHFHLKLLLKTAWVWNRVTWQFRTLGEWTDTDMRRLTTGIRSEKCVVKRFRRCANIYLHKPRQYSLLDTKAIWYSLLLLSYKPVQHITVLNTAGNCKTTAILWDHRRICGPSFTVTSLWGAYLYWCYHPDMPAGTTRLNGL